MENTSADTPKENDTLNLFSFCLSEKERKSEHQILIDSNTVRSAQKSITTILRNHFIRSLFREIKSEHLDEFLNFHYIEYQGDKQQFLRSIWFELNDFFKELIRPESVARMDIEKSLKFTIDGVTISSQNSMIVVDPPNNFGPYNLQDYIHFENVLQYFDSWKTNKEKALDWSNAEEGNEPIIKKISSVKPPKNIKLWKGDEESLEMLWKLLIHHKFISYIDKNQFINHFTGRKYHKLIEWTKEQVVLIRLL
jgi:hypothetical protein